MGKSRLAATILTGALAAALMAGGCVERRMFIRSEPPGAYVAVNGRDHGATPAVVPFLTYGTVEVMLSAPGHRRLRATVDLEPPWWQQIPVDFFVEHLWPATLVDEHALAFTLEPIPESSDADIDAAEKRLRDRLDSGKGPTP